MRIAYVVNQFPPHITSGLGRYVEELAPRLASGHELLVFTLNDGTQPVDERRGNVTAYRPLGRLLGAVKRRRRLNRTRRLEFLLLVANVLGSNGRYVWRLWRLPAGQRPHVVAVHDSTNFLCGLLCHYLLRLPVVFHVHTTEYGVAPQRTIADPLRLYARLERWLGRVARRVVVATPEVRDQLAAAGWDRGRIDVVWLGSTFERVFARDLPSGPDLRARFGIPAAAPVLLFVGRIERQKGIYQLLTALPRIAAAIPDLHLVIAGEGDEAGVARMAAESGLADRVHLSEEFVSREVLLAYYRMADACAFPSLFEPFGLVATEAMALGIPTIVGDGFSRIFLGDPDHPAVRFVRGGDPDDIAAGVIEVMADPRLREELGERGERFVRERLSWTRTAEATLEIYCRATGPSR